MCTRHFRRVATCRQGRPLFQKGINALGSLDTAGSAPPPFGGSAKRQWFCPFVIGDTASKCVCMGVDVRHVVDASGISWVKLWRLPGNTSESHAIGSRRFRTGFRGCSRKQKRKVQGRLHVDQNVLSLVRASKSLLSYVLYPTHQELPR